MKSRLLNRDFLLPDQGSNLDFLESKSSVLPVTPSGNQQPLKKGFAKVELFFKSKTRFLPFLKEKSV
jgi:hypothetical protein